MERHRKDVDKIAKQVRGFYRDKIAFRINHGSTNSTRQSALERSKTVDIGHLKYVLDVNVQSQTILVEPNVPMDRLAETTLKYGLIPPVVMEFPGITVGGGYAGTSGESSSFKYGFFDNIIESVEMVLADGEVVTASRTERSDLFHGAAGACGTLGITTLVELQLIEAKKYVRTTYYKVNGMPDAVSQIESIMKDKEEIDYLDGIMFSKNSGVIVTGRLTDNPENGKVQTFNRATDPWFYLHAHDLYMSPSGSSLTSEYVPLESYLFRYDRGGFWVGRSAFQYFFTPFTNYTRWYLDKYVRVRMIYTALHATAHAKDYIVQDLALPFSKASEFVDFTDETFGIYPLWLCPLRQSPQPTFHPHSSEVESDGKTPKPMLNIGLWGYGPRNHDELISVNGKLEIKLKELEGMKWLYAQTYYSEEDFWDLYGQDWYNSLRKKYKATSLPNVYDKVKVDVAAERKVIKSSWWLWFLSFWPVSGLWGLWKARSSGQHLLGDRATWRSIEEKDRSHDS